MTSPATHPDAVEQLKRVRQARQYEEKLVTTDILNNLLEVAQWTGSSRNTQPWHFVVIHDKAQLKAISEIRTPINWVADAPLAIGIVLKGGSTISEAYDEGRVTERLLIAARFLGLGGGVAWFGDEGQQAQGQELLGVPDGMLARSVVVLGYPKQFKDHRPNPAQSGRHPLNEIVSYGTFGKSR